MVLATPNSNKFTEGVMDKKIYKRVTEFFEKENRRIGNRISWLFATQTLIFGAFEYVNEFDKNFRIEFLNAIAQIGLWSSVCFALSILAAAINYMYIYYPLSHQGDNDYPSLKGGIVQWLCIPVGFIAAVGLPVIFAVAWLNIPEIT